jgi:2-oxoisovalerate dehydrogenase E1 component
MTTSPLSDPVERVHRQFLSRVESDDLPASPVDRRSGDDGAGPAVDDPVAVLDVVRAQLISRHLDRLARELRAAGDGFYTIGSSGHEGMAAVAAALRPTDPAFLHYRDAAFQLARAAQVADPADPAASERRCVRDMVLSFLASSDDPISGGRHKVLGSAELTIPPQTSTIASHLPKAVGAAYSIGLAAERSPEHQRFDDDAIVMASFGDASVNHASAQAAFNTAGWTAYQGVTLPLLLVCEDNGIGISVPTPKGWVAASMANRPGLTYRSCDGLDLRDTLAVARECAEEVRRTRRPVFLHLSCVRLYGHAGADLESVYRTPAQIAAAARDEDPDAIGLSILSGSHLALVPDTLARIRSEGVDAPVVVGGIIPTEDRAELLAGGVAAVYTPADYKLGDIIADLADLALAHRQS